MSQDKNSKSFNYRMKNQIAIFCLLLWTQTPCQEHNLNQGILFTYEDDVFITNNNWIVVMDVEPRQYVKSLHTIQQWLNELQQPKGPYDAAVFSRVATSDIELELIRKRIKSLRKQIESVCKTLTPDNALSKRRKRGLINAGGHILKFLFGTPDNADLETINNQINRMSNHNNKMIHLLENQASFLNSTFEVAKNNSYAIQALKRATIQMHNFVQDINDKVNRIDCYLRALSIVSTNIRIIGSMLDHIENEFSQTLIALETAENSRLSPFFIPPGTLFAILFNIKESLPSHLNYIVALKLENMPELYDMITVSVAATQGKFRLFITIPLQALDHTYSLYKAFAFPHYDKKGQVYLYLKPAYKFIAINRARDKYFELDDLSSCRGSIYKICSQEIPIRTDPNLSCSFSILMGLSNNVKTLCESYVTKKFKPIWYKIKFSNKWAYSLSKETKVYIDCIGNATTTLSLNNTGVLEVPARCGIRAENHLMLSHFHETTKVNLEPDVWVLPEYKHLQTAIELDSVLNITKEEIPDIMTILDSVQEVDLETAGIASKRLRNSLLELSIDENKHRRTTWIIVCTTISIIILLIVIYRKVWWKLNGKLKYRAWKSKRLEKREQKKNPPQEEVREEEEQV